MTRLKMRFIVFLMCTTIVAVVILQGNWLMNSYAVSREKGVVEVEALMKIALYNQKQQAADTARQLMLRVIRSENDFMYRIVDFADETAIGMASKKGHTYAMYTATPQDTVLIKKDPYHFLTEKIKTLEVEELSTLSAALIGTNDYPENSPEKKIALELGSIFDRSLNTKDLKIRIARLFVCEGEPFHGNIRYFDDISKVYSKLPKREPVIKRRPTNPNEILAVLPGAERSKSLGVKLDLLKTYTDSLNRIGDSVYVAKPLFVDVSSLISEKIPVILLSAHTPRTFIGKKMWVNIGVGLVSMLFIALCLIYMYQIIIKQKQLADLKNDFISNISHELKTPIATASAAIQGLDFFDPTQNPEKTKSYLRVASSEIGKLSAMVEKILNVTIFEQGTFELAVTRFNFRSLLERIIESQQLRNDKDIEISLDYEAKTEISADQSLLQNVLINLIDNAIKYSGPKVKIEIQCRNDQHGIEISIRDNGIGIPAQYSDFIFDKFFRVPNKTGHSVKGHGLGLGYARAIIEKHGGLVMLGDSGGQGSLFIIKLPQP